MSRKAKRATAPSRRDECGALPEPKQAETEKKHRKPVFTLPPEKVVEQCLKDERDLICAGQVLAVQQMMVAAQWPIAVLSSKSHVSKSHLSEFLRLKKFLTCQLMRRIAGAFGLKLSQMDQLAEKLVDC